MLNYHVISSLAYEDTITLWEWQQKV